MKKGDYLNTILRLAKTVFTVADVGMIWRESRAETVGRRLNYYANKGDLYRIRRGIYAKDKNYDRWELATRILTPAYVSLESVLAKEGVIFQYSETITVVSYLTREIEIDEQKYEYKKIKNEILVNSLNIEEGMASRERAVLDTLYFSNDYHFDNLRSINWEKVTEMLPIYKNIRMENLIKKMVKENKDDT